MNKHTTPQAGYIAVAAKKFAAEGYHGTSLDAVAREAGVTKQALLHFFGTKKKLYEAVLSDLAARQCAEIDQVATDSPAQHLSDYFSSFGSLSIVQSNDARLVIHALLDSESNAQNWPMKPYLDRLIELVLAVPEGKINSRGEALAWIFQIVGAIQYFAISSTAITGMYGSGDAQSSARHFEKLIASGVASLSAPRK
ncbi:MAG: TetR/AcrR family transcriptional regulator [Pseudomonadota bacterium]